MSADRLANLREIVSKLLRRKAYGRLQKVLAKTHVADAAALMRFASARDRRQMFDLLPGRDQQAELLGEVDQAVVEEFARALDDDFLIDLLGRMQSDDAADVLGLVDESRAETLLRRLRSVDDAVEGLLRYDEETAGGIMATDFFSLPEETTAGDATRHLQTAADVEMAFYIYVVNDHGHLVGVVSLRQLVVCPPQTQLKDLMETDVISVRATEDREEVARTVARYNILAVPVVDESNKLLGIVTVDDVIDVMRDEATEDILKMAGAGAEALLEDHSVRKAVRVRMPWLLASFAGGVGAAAIVAWFEESLHSVAALAAFIPIVLGMGGNVGTQSSTLIVRGLATGRVDVERLGRVVGRELLVGLALGVTYGLLLAAVAMALYRDGLQIDPLPLGLSVGLAICACMCIAAMVGAGLPLMFQRLHIDPAVATGPFVTTAVDVSGIVVYFTIAKALIPHIAAVAG